MVESCASSGHEVDHNVALLILARLCERFGPTWIVRSRLLVELAEATARSSGRARHRAIAELAAELAHQVGSAELAGRARRPPGLSSSTWRACASAYGLVESSGSSEREVDHNVVLLILARLCDRSASSPRRYVAGDRVRSPDVDPSPSSSTRNCAKA